MWVEVCIWFKCDCCVLICKYEWFGVLVLDDCNWVDVLFDVVVVVMIDGVCDFGLCLLFVVVWFCVCV